MTMKGRSAYEESAALFTYNLGGNDFFGLTAETLRFTERGLNMV